MLFILHHTDGKDKVKAKEKGEGEGKAGREERKEESRVCQHRGREAFPTGPRMRVIHVYQRHTPHLRARVSLNILCQQTSAILSEIFRDKWLGKAGAGGGGWGGLKRIG